MIEGFGSVTEGRNEGQTDLQVEIVIFSVPGKQYEGKSGSLPWSITLLSRSQRLKLSLGASIPSREWHIS